MGAEIRGVDLSEPLAEELRKTAAETVNFGNVWHTDFTNLKLPSLANALYAKQIPDFGGDTNFINMYAAYEALSSGLNTRRGWGWFRLDIVHRRKLQNAPPRLK